MVWSFTVSRLDIHDRELLIKMQDFIHVNPNVLFVQITPFVAIATDMNLIFFQTIGIVELHLGVKLIIGFFNERREENYTSSIVHWNWELQGSVATIYL